MYHPFGTKRADGSDMQDESWKGGMVDKTRTNTDLALTGTESMDSMDRMDEMDKVDIMDIGKLRKKLDSGLNPE